MGEERVRGKRAVITGAGTGIGAAIAKRLAAEGATVVLAGRREQPLRDIAGSIAAAGGATPRVVACDVTRADDVARLARDAGAADIVVNNAGVAPSAPFLKTDDDTWQRTMATNLGGTVSVTRALLPGMLERGWGRVINVASVAGKSGMRYTSAYAASKHAVLGLTKTLALEVAAKGVTVNAVCPGWVDTEMSDVAIANITSKTKQSAADARRGLEALSPQKRLFEPDEIAALVAWLCSDGARGVTAQAINLDGGALQS